MATRSSYQPQFPQTWCGLFAAPQRGHEFRVGAWSFQAEFLLLLLFDLDVFFFGTAIDFSITLVTSELAQIRSYLPRDFLAPIVRKLFI